MDVAGLRRLLEELDDCTLAGEEEAVLYRRVWLGGLREALPALLAVAEAAAHYLKHGDQRGKLVRALAALAAPAEKEET